MLQNRTKEVRPVKAAQERNGTRSQDVRKLTKGCYMDIESICGSKDESFRYQLLDRMKGDCAYYLGYGNRNEKHLWAKNVPDQIAYMKALWHSFPLLKKPQWLTMRQIRKLEKQMKSE